MLLHFHNPSCGYNQRCNLSQETLPLLQSILTSLFHPYLFTKSSLQFPLTLPSYITQQFFTSLFLRTIIPTTCTKNIFPTSNILAIQAALSDLAVTKYCEKWHCFNLFFLPQTMDCDSRGYSQSLILYRSDSKKNDILQVWQTIKSTFSHTINLFSLLPYSASTTTRTHIPMECKDVKKMFGSCPSKVDGKTLLLNCGFWLK